jgi:hypothetical protein
MMSFAVIVIVKATLVCGAAFLLAHVCRRSRASVRHLLFALAFAALIAIPMTGAIVPALTVMLPAPAPSPVASRSEVQVSMPSSVPDGTAASNGPAIVKTSSAWPLTIPQSLAVLWLMGVVVFLTPVVAGVWQVSRLRRTATPWPGGQEFVQSLASKRGVRGRSISSFTRPSWVR